MGYIKTKNKTKDRERIGGDRESAMLSLRKK